MDFSGNKRYRSIIACCLLGCLTGWAAADDFAFFYDGSYVDTTTEAANLRTSVLGLGHTAPTFTGTDLASFTAALAGKDGLILPEQENGDLYGALDGDTRTLITNFVESGGLLLITARDTNFSGMINGLFGESISGAGTTSSNSALTGDATGTVFAGGPATLPPSSAVYSLSASSLPAAGLSMYETGNQSTVAIIPETAGYVAWLGFDWFTEPIPGDWNTVLGSALTFVINKWDGSSSGVWSTDANWTDNDAPGAGDSVIFAGTVNTTVTHDQAAGTQYAGITFNSDCGTFDITNNALGIADGGSITNESTNTQTLSVGVTTGGDVTYDAASGNFIFSGTQTLGSGHTLTVTGANDTTISGQITGAGALSKTGAGNLTLSGANDYSGGTTVSAGTLTGSTTSLQGAITNNAAVVFSQAGDGTYSGIMGGTGTLTKLGAGNVTLSGANTYNGGTTVTAGTLTGSTTSLQGAITNNAAVVFSQAGDGTYSGIMGGTGTLTKLGAGNVTLSGANTYNGGTTVTAGTLTGSTTSLQGAITNNAAVVFDQAGDGTYAGIMGGTGTLTKLGAGNVTLSGANTYNGGTTVSAGTLTGTTTSLQGAITNNAAVVFSQAGDGTYAGIMGGTGTLTKLGAGNVTLSGANIYSGGTTVTAGTLTGSTTSLQGDILNNAAVVLNQATDGEYAGAMSGTGTLAVQGGGEVTLSGTNIHTGNTTLAAGTLILTGSVAGNLLVNGGTLEGTGAVGGDLTVAVGATHAPGASIGTTPVAGDYTLSGTLDAEVSKDAGGTLTADLVNVAGSATLDNGSTITVTDLDGGGTIFNADAFRVIATGGGVTDNGVAVTSMSAFLAFNGSIIGNDYYVTARRISSFAPQALGTNNRRLAESLDTDQANISGDFAAVYNNLLMMSAGGFNDAARRMNGEPHMAAHQATVRSTQLQASELAGHLDHRRRGTVDPKTAQTKSIQRLPMLSDLSESPTLLAQAIRAGDVMADEQAPGWHVFAKPFTAIHHQDSSADRLGYRGNSYGGQVGVDRTIAPGLIAGVAVSAAETRLHFDSARGLAETTSIRVGPYATVYRDGFSLDLWAAYGFHHNQVERKIRFGSIDRRADSEYDAHEAVVYVGGQKDFDVTGYTLSPTASLQYICQQQDSFTESGADSLNLRVESETFQSLQSRVGLRASRKFEINKGTALIPEVTAGWAHEYLGGQAVTSRFAGGATPFTTTAGDPNRDSAYVGAAVTVLQGRNVLVSVRYEGEFSSDTCNHWFSAGLNWKF